MNNIYNNGLKKNCINIQSNRCDFANIIGYEKEWLKNSLNIAFTKKKSIFYEIKKIQTNIYLKLIKKYLPIKKNLSVLDFGGGIGRFIPYFINKCKYYDFVESCKSNINFAIKQNKKKSNIEFYFQNLESFQTKKRYDLIIASEIICYHKSPILLIKNLKKLLTPNGIIFFSIENVKCSKFYYPSKLKKTMYSKSFPYKLYEKNNYFLRPTTLKLFLSCLNINDFLVLESNYIFDKLEGKNYNKLLFNKLSDIDYIEKLIAYELNSNKESAEKNCRAIYAIVKQKKLLYEKH